MELHTLGVDGGYTQDDVIAVARAFTGWTIYDPTGMASSSSIPAMHDREGEGRPRAHASRRGRRAGRLDVIDILARHPSTATFISTKLAQRFVADDPPRVAGQSDGRNLHQDRRRPSRRGGDAVDLARVPVRGAWQSKLKSPLEIVVSSAPCAECRRHRYHCARAAHRRARTAALWKAGADRLSEYRRGHGRARPALLGRINFATALTAGQIQGVKVDITSRLDCKPAEAVAAELLGIAPSAANAGGAREAHSRGQVDPGTCSRRSSSRHRNFKRGSHVHSTLLHSDVRDDDGCAWRRAVLAAPRSGRRAATSSKILVAIFQRGAADGLNIVVPFFEKRYYQLRPTIAVPPRRASRTAASISMDDLRCIRRLQPLSRSGTAASSRSFTPRGRRIRRGRTSTHRTTWSRERRA